MLYLAPKYCQTWKTCTQKKYRLTTGASAGEIRIDSPDCKPYPGQEPEGTAYYCLGYIEKLNPFSKKTRKVEVGVDESKCVEPCEGKIINLTNFHLKLSNGLMSIWF